MPGQGAARRARAAATPPLLITKRLVAHLPYSWQRWGSGPRDGDPVGVPVPCSRVRAGYWCDCTEGSSRDHEDADAGPTSQARVEPAPLGQALGYVDTSSAFLGPHGSASPDDESALQRQIEALPVGTVVERMGTGIAIQFVEAPRVDGGSTGG